MQIKGLDTLRKYVPQLRSPGGFLLFAAEFLVIFAGTTLFFIAIDRFYPEWMPDGEILVLALGFLIFSLFITQRKRYKQQFGESAYRTAFVRFIIPGLGLITASIAHLGYIPGPELPNLYWKTILVWLGWVSLAVGIALWVRAVCVLGVDTLTMLYVYHPEDSRMVDEGIYHLMRHPIYAAALRIGSGLALIHANWYALVVALILWIFFAGWIRLVEEKELIERFPQYPEYRRQVPAFCPSLRNIGRFWHFMILGG